jgi:hypothetical protein
MKAQEFLRCASVARARGGSIFWPWHTYPFRATGLSRNERLEIIYCLDIDWTFASPFNLFGLFIFCLFCNTDNIDVSDLIQVRITNVNACKTLQFRMDASEIAGMRVLSLSLSLNDRK